MAQSLVVYGYIVVGKVKLTLTWLVLFSPSLLPNLQSATKYVKTLRPKGPL